MELCLIKEGDLRVEESEEEVEVPLHIVGDGAEDRRDHLCIIILNLRQLYNKSLH